jgi:hypothetical protein
MENILNEINVEINKRFEEIQQSEYLNILFIFSNKCDNDLSNIAQKSLKDLEREITFPITKNLMNIIK